MIFTFPRKKIVLDCFTKHSFVHEYAPITLANKYYPDWWKRLPKHGRINENLFNDPNMKSCQGMIDLYASGIMLPMWSDLRLNVSPGGGVIYQYSDGLSSAEFHSYSQRDGWAPPSLFVHMKLVSPWFVSCKENIRWVTLPPIYNQNNLTSYLLCTGVLDFKYQHSANINWMLPIPKQKMMLEIAHGQPLMHIIPMSDRKIKVRNHLVSEEEYRKMESKQNHFTFSRFYEKIRHLNKGKCPYS